MNFVDNLWDKLGIFEPAEEGRSRQAEPDKKNKKGAPPMASTSSNNSFPIPGNNVLPFHAAAAGQQALSSVPLKQLKVVVVEPLAFDDAQSVADYLKAKKPVVINLENTDQEITRRMIDFISGTTYALNGTMQKVGNNIFLCAPSNVDIDVKTREEKKESGFLSWQSSHSG